MKNKTVYLLVFIPFVLAAIIAAKMFDTDQTSEPWQEDQLMPPAQLAISLNDSSGKQPVIFNIGPSGSIKDAIDIDPANEKKSQAKMEKELKKLSKDSEIVIYCGCCPFKDCPNIRPAFKLLNKLGYINHKLLNLPKNLKVDWIDKGYPMARK